MKILVSEMPKKKEECLFYRKETYYGSTMKNAYCGVNNAKCSFKNGDSIFGGECRCLRVGPTRD